MSLLCKSFYWFTVRQYWKQLGYFSLTLMANFWTANVFEWGHPQFLIILFIKHIKSNCSWHKVLYSIFKHVKQNVKQTIKAITQDNETIKAGSKSHTLVKAKEKSWALRWLSKMGSEDTSLTHSGRLFNNLRAAIEKAPQESLLVIFLQPTGCSHLSSHI